MLIDEDSPEVYGSIVNRSQDEATDCDRNYISDFPNARSYDEQAVRHTVNETGFGPPHVFVHVVQDWDENGGVNDRPNFEKHRMGSDVNEVDFSKGFVFHKHDVISHN